MNALRQHNSFLVLFFDFYVINELYLRCGGFRDVGYPKYDVFVPEKIYETIKFQYEHTVELMFEHTVRCLANTTRGELVKHFYSEAYLQDDGCNYMTRDRLLKREGYTLKIFYRDGIIKHADRAYTLFFKYNWSDSYGGKAWAKGAKALADLKNVKTLKDKVYWIDRVMDLQHNNGHILNKTDFNCLSHYVNGFNGTYLDFRARCKTIFDLLDLCSFKVKKLTIPRKRILI